MNDDDRDVMEFVQSGRVNVGEGAAARVRAALAVPTGAASGGADARAPGRRAPRLFAAALVLLGALVVAGVAWLQRGTVGTAPAQEPQRPAPQRPVPQEPPEPGDPNVAEDDPSAQQPLDLAATLRTAPLVLVVDVFFPSGVLATDGTFGTVKRVLQGDGALAGKQVWLHWNAVAGAGRGFLDQVDLASTESRVAEGGEVLGFPWLLALAPMTDAEKAQAGPTKTTAWVDRAAALPWLHSPTGKGLPATKATRNAPEATGDGKQLVLAWLAAGCKDADAGVRADSAQAIAAAGELPPGLDVAALAADPLPQVRAAAAAFAPKAALLRLAFDRSDSVRSAAASAFGAGAPAGLDQVCCDGMWTFATNDHEWRVWEQHALRSAEGAHIDTHAGAFARQLHDKTGFMNHLFGALGLGRSGDKQQLPELVALAGHKNSAVRVAAAWSRVLLGDRQGHDLLRAMATGDDAQTAVMALDAVRALECVESFTTLAAAAKSKVAAVRALAAAGLREQRARGEHEVDALLAELRKDPMEIVRLAAAAR